MALRTCLLTPLGQDVVVQQRAYHATKCLLFMEKLLRAFHRATIAYRTCKLDTTCVFLRRINNPPPPISLMSFTEITESTRTPNRRKRSAHADAQHSPTKLSSNKKSAVDNFITRTLKPKRFASFVLGGLLRLIVFSPSPLQQFNFDPHPPLSHLLLS